MNLFFDTIGKDRTLAAIVVTYTEGNERRTEIGAPYAVHDSVLEIAPYLKTNYSSVPNDADAKTKKIPLDQIVSYNRVNLVGFV